MESEGRSTGSRKGKTNRARLTASASSEPQGYHLGNFNHHPL